MSTIAVNAITNAAGGNTATINGMTPTADSLQGFRNRILNGGMVIDQRNAGASVTPTTNNTYTLDRWTAGLTQTSKFSVQQNSGTVTPPTGYTNYLGCVSLSAFSVASSDTFFVQQRVEGFNTADLGWGTASAQSITISFWVRSSLTGTFGGSVMNGDANRAYPFTYAVSAANTWEQKTVTVAGDTTGTWLTTNGIGLRLTFSLGTGSTLAATAGVWAAGNFLSATGAVSVVGTSGATFYITGVQLEAGSVATPFERRDYGRELIMCQRYYWQNVGSNFFLNGYNVTGGLVYADIPNPVTMRANPTVTLSTFDNLNAGNAAVNSGSTQRIRVQMAMASTGAGYSTFNITVSAEL